MVRRLSQVKTFLLVGLALLAAVARAETVFVKYGGMVDLAPFTCEWTPRSSFINRVCHDPRRNYVVVMLGGTYYHYCGMPSGIVRAWLSADSMGRFYNASIKGRFGCQ